VVRRDHPLAAMDKITIDDLLPHNIIISTQGLSEEISGWCGDRANELKVTDTVILPITAPGLSGKILQLC
ncbi:MAG: hypothetical protein J6P43_06910, partial [Succinivibrionaceae bacterium]|nr:hypothetical protein [Succinivibrionaceae bacterium]